MPHIQDRVWQRRTGWQPGHTTGEGQWHARLRRGAEPRLTKGSAGPVKRATDILCRSDAPDSEGPHNLQEGRMHHGLRGFRTFSMTATLQDAQPHGAMSGTEPPYRDEHQQSYWGIGRLGLDHRAGYFRPLRIIS